MIIDLCFCLVSSRGPTIKTVSTAGPCNTVLAGSNHDLSKQASGIVLNLRCTSPAVS